MEVLHGFSKATINNLPQVTIEMIFSFAVEYGTVLTPISAEQRNDFLIDYVQLKRTDDVCEINALIFRTIDDGESDGNINVALKIDEKAQYLTEVQCNLCAEQISCTHIVYFLFWLHRKSTETRPEAVCEFWGHEFESSIETQQKAVRICDLMPVTEERIKADAEIADVTDEQGMLFLQTVLEDLDNIGARDSALYRQCVEVKDEFEPIFIHHTLLRRNTKNFDNVNFLTQHMELQAGLFENLNEATKFNYKSTLWLEAQYMRLRCSLIHKITCRKTVADNEEIFNAMSCTDRDKNIAERLQLKQHKRFILKQTEKLESKTYYECGLLLHEAYPYIIASPDGITDDHIVEIKAPKTEDDFEKYLEERETIAPKYMTQIQIQMYIANVTKALYCVLSPTFNTNGALHYVWVQADHAFVQNLLKICEEFWKTTVFPHMQKIYQLQVKD